MTKDQKGEILDYCTPPKAVSIVGIAVMLLSPAAYFISDAIKHDEVLNIAAAISMLLVGILFLSLRPWYGANVVHTLKKHEEDNGSGKIYYDFCHGDRIANDMIRCGERYLFCKGMGVSVYCPDIANIKYRELDYKFITTNDEIVVRLKSREKLVIHSMPHEKRNKAKFMDIINAISKRCPDAEISI